MGRPADINRTEKSCGKCKEVKLLDEFYRDAKAFDGHDSRCIACRKDYKKQYYAQNEQLLKDKAKAWRDANPEHAAATARAWTINNLERKRESNRLHYASNKEAYYESVRRRQVIKKNAFVEDVSRFTVFDRDKGTCGICGGTDVEIGNFHVDHIIPLSEGGEHSYNNVQLAHPACNLAKGNKMDYKHREVMA